MCVSVCACGVCCVVGLAAAGRDTRTKKCCILWRAPKAGHLCECECVGVYASVFAFALNALVCKFV